MICSELLHKPKLYDLAATSPLVMLYGVGIVGLFRRDAAILNSQVSFDLLVAILSDVLTITFLGLQIALFVIRRLPLYKAQGWAPRLAAIVGSNLLLGLLVLSQPRLSTTLAIASNALVGIGTLSCVYVAACLGRSFSVLPQARGLITSGPYRFVRHPLYLAEQIAALGLMLKFQQPWSLLIVLANFAAQFPRMHYEEQILSKAFTAYRDYSERTRRLIPGVY
jgi:protein-S-isoprenylcysteine O-methyltransferase Ste14